MAVVDNMILKNAPGSQVSNFVNKNIEKKKNWWNAQQFNKELEKHHWSDQTRTHLSSKPPTTINT